MVKVLGATPSRPDLIVPSVTSPFSVEAGRTVSITFMVRNQGTAATGAFTNRVFLATTSHGEHIHLGDFQMTSLAAGVSSQVQSVEVVIPAGTSPGSYFLTVAVDGYGVIAETNEGNNMGSTTPSRIRINPPGPPPQPDLIVPSVTSPFSVEAGRTVSITFMVRNQGTAATGAFTNRVFLATTSHGEHIHLGDFQMTSLAAGVSSQVQSVEVVIPAGTSPGSYFLTVAVDGYGVIAETNEGNNMGSTTPSRIRINPPGPLNPVITIPDNEPRPAPPIAVLIDNKPLSMEVPPIKDNNRVMVPLRSIAEALGAEVRWDNRTNSVSLVRGELTVKLFPGSSVAFANDRPINLDAPAKIWQNRFMVPVRFVSEVFGQIVNWIAGSIPGKGRVEINTNLKIKTTVLSDIVKPGVYDFTLKAIGGVMPYRWSLVNGKLPPGLELTENGQIVGVPEPTPNKLYEFTIQVVHSGNQPQKNEQTFSIKIDHNSNRWLLDFPQNSWLTIKNEHEQLWRYYSNRIATEYLDKSLIIHWPEKGDSGITLGLGYDIGQRHTKNQVIADLKRAGISYEQAKMLAKAVQKTGSVAEEFERENKDEWWARITRKQQYHLFNYLFMRYKEKTSSLVNESRPWGIRFTSEERDAFINLMAKMGTPVTANRIIQPDKGINHFYIMFSGGTNNTFNQLSPYEKEVAIDLAFNLGEDQFRIQNWSGVFSMDSTAMIAAYLGGGIGGRDGIRGLLVWGNKNPRLNREGQHLRVENIVWRTQVERRASNIYNWLRRTD
jgi:Flp pilus assembly protein TadG